MGKPSKDFWATLAVTLVSAALQTFVNHSDSPMRSPSKKKVAELQN